MRILNLSIDSSIIKKDSPSAKRVLWYADLVDRYDVVAPAGEDKEIVLTGKSKIYGIKTGNKFFGLLKIYKLAKRLAKKEKYDLISVQDPYFLGFLGLLLAKKFHLGLELQVHGWEKLGGARKMAARFVLPKADAVRAVSQRLKKQLIEEFGVKEEKITVVPIFSDFRFKNYELRIKEEGGKFIFLTVGRLVAVKNIGMQIEAMAEVVRATHNLPAGQAGAQRITQVELWIAGEGMEGEKLKVKSEKLKIENNVKFFGWQDDLDKFYSQADVFLLTSNYEGWGLVAIEAASYGLPIIMTDVGCAGEVIKNPSINSGQASGIVIPVGDKDKLVEAMIKIIEDKDLRKKLGVNAREAVAKLPTKEETLALYRESWEKALKIKIAL